MTPTDPEQAAARVREAEWAQTTMIHVLTHPPDYSPGVHNLARAYLALLAERDRLREAIAWIDGKLLCDVDACAMGTATESHYDVMARDLRERLLRRAARAAATPPEAT